VKENRQLSTEGTSRTDRCVRGHIFDARQRDRDRLEKSKQRDQKAYAVDHQRRRKKNVQGREGEGNLWSWCLKKGKGKLTVHSEDLLNSDKL
jgi:hypothetical protein